MPTLGQIAEARLSTGLAPIINSWSPDAPLPTRLMTGRNAALAALQKYVPDFAYDPSEAKAQMADVDAWAERNEQALAAIMQSPTEQLPEQLRLEMGSSRAQAFVLGIFTQAAVGLGPWASGAVAREADRGTLLNERWARTDAAQRLEAFALIVKLDQGGQLQQIFQPGSMGALGVAPWLIVVALVVVAAAIVTGVVLWRRLDLNNRLLSEICRKAQEEGDQETLERCLEAAEGLQVTPLESAAVAFSSRLAWALVAAGGVYVGLRWGMPWAAKQLQEARKA